MNFFNSSEFAQYARATLKRRRGWGLLGLGIAGWIVVLVFGYACYLLVRQMAG
jgi:hypothetical protein